MKNPVLDLKIDKELDVINAKGFLYYEKNQWFIKRFLPKELHYVSGKNVSKKEREKIINKYVKDFYLDNDKEIRRGLVEAKKDWKKIEKKYFKLVKEVFEKRNWPKGKYKGVISIFNMYPRWIERKTFFIPYKNSKKSFSNEVIAHEMLHFIFFDFIKKKHNLNEHSKIKGKSASYVWKVSEVFNNVILNSRSFQSILNRKEKPYPGTEKIFKKMTAQWRNKKDINWLLEQWFE